MKEIILFDKVLADTSRADNHLNSFETEVINKALEKGIIVNPEADMRRVNSYLNTLPSKMITLHPSFEAVRNTPKAVLYIQQLSHYISTYGTNFTGEVYLPSWGRCDIDLKELRHLEVMTEKEMRDAIEVFINTGLALSNDILDILIDLIREFNIRVLSNQTNNKELSIRLMIHNREKPSNADEMMRIINYVLTGKTTIIKNRSAIESFRCNISENAHLVSSIMFEFGLDKVSSIFNRYKCLFFAMKRDGRLAPVINRISKLSKVHHKPMQMPFASVFLTENHMKDYFHEPKYSDYTTALDILISKSTIFQLEKYRRAVRKRLAVRGSTDQYTTVVTPSKLEDLNVYNIRNGKIFIKSTEACRTISSNACAMWHMIKDRITSEINSRINTKVDGRNVLTGGVNFALPTSQKDFIGHLPYGSSIELGDDWENIQIGIHWTDKDGGRDLDLSLECTDGRMISWNTNQKVDGITHTGDMTSANPEATEIISVTDTSIPASKIVVNPFNCLPDAEFTFFIAKNADTTKDRMQIANDCMNNDGNIIFSTKLKLTGQLNIGYISNRTFYFSGRETGKDMVMNHGRWNNSMTIAEIDNMKTFTRIEDVTSVMLSDDGINGECIDLTTKDKTALIELLS